MEEAVAEKPNPVSFMGRHFVALACKYESFKDDGSLFHRGTAVFSGFVLALHNYMFWVTAGHCLKDALDEPIRKGILKIITSSLMDCFGHEAKHLEAIPFEYELDCGLHVDLPDLGLDYALIPLSRNTCALLAANNIKAIGRENWISQAGIEFDKYLMYGIPENNVFEEAGDDGDVNVTVRPVMLAINRLDPATVENVASDQWFVGQIDDKAEIPSIKGMSGGPIYGFRKNSDGKLLYHAVALQSWWNKDSRTIFGCSLPLFAEEAHETLGALLKEYGDNAPDTFPDHNES